MEVKNDTLIGYTLDEFPAALDAMERSTPAGKWCNIALACDKMPTKEQCDLAWAQVTITGHHMTKPITQFVNGTAYVSFNIQRDVPYVKYQWQIIIPLIVPVLTIGLVGWGITKIKEIGESVLPIIAVAIGGLVIIVAALRKSAEKFVDRGGVEQLVGAKMLPRTLGKRDFFMKDCLQDHSMRECAVRYNDMIGKNRSYMPDTLALPNVKNAMNKRCVLVGNAYDTIQSYLGNIFKNLANKNVGEAQNLYDQLKNSLDEWKTGNADLVPFITGDQYKFLTLNIESMISKVSSGKVDPKGDELRDFYTSILAELKSIKFNSVCNCIGEQDTVLGDFIDSYNDEKALEKRYRNRASNSYKVGDKASSEFFTTMATSEENDKKKVEAKIKESGMNIFSSETEMMPVEYMPEAKTQMQLARDMWNRTPLAGRKAILKKALYPQDEAYNGWSELREDRRIWIIEDHYMKVYPEKFNKLTPYKKQAFGLTSNPPPTIEVKGQKYEMVNSFPTRVEASEEAQSYRDSGYKTDIQPYEGHYVVYVSQKTKYEPATITQMEMARDMWSKTPRLEREAILIHSGFPPSESVFEWNELSEHHKVWIIEFHYKEQYPEKFSGELYSPETKRGDFVTITDSGDTELTEGSIISMTTLNKENERMKSLNLKPARYYIPPIDSVDPGDTEGPFPAGEQNNWHLILRLTR